MTFLDDFGELLTQECTREAWTGQDDFAQPTYGAATTHRCRVVHKPTLVRSVVGARSEVQGSVQELVSNAQVWTAHLGWSPQDRITLPDGSQPLILDIRSYPDHSGDHHQVVYV